MSVDADIPASLDLFGLHASDLQSGVSVNKLNVAGTLKYVTDYTGFSGNPEEQNGHYLVLHADDENADKVVVELLGGTKGPVELDPDRTIVLLIRNKDTQSVKVTSYLNDEVKETGTFSLANLVLEPAPNDEDVSG